MIVACEGIVTFSADISDVDLTRRDLPYRSAVLHELIILGEACKQLSLETRQLAPDIPWTRISRLRDRLVHYYHGVDKSILLDIVRHEVPGILPDLRRLRTGL